MDTQASKLEKARVRLLTKSPFFGVLAYKTPVVLTNRHPSGKPVRTAVNDGNRIYIRPEYLDMLTVTKVMTLLANNYVKIVGLHVLRRGKRSKDMWNTASNFVANGILKDADFDLPDGAAYDEAFGKLSVEEVYDILREIANNMAQNQQDDDGDPDDDQDGDGDGGGQGQSNDMHDEIVLEADAPSGQQSRSKSEGGGQSEQDPASDGDDSESDTPSGQTPEQGQGDGNPDSNGNDQQPNNGQSQDNSGGNDQQQAGGQGQQPGDDPEDGEDNQQDGGGKGDSAPEDGDDDADGDDGQQDDGDDDGDGDPEDGEDGDGDQPSDAEGKSNQPSPDYDLMPTKEELKQFFGELIEPCNSDGKPMSPAEAEEARREWGITLSQAAQTQMSQVGNMPGSLQRLLDEVRAPEKDNWKDEIQQWLTSMFPKDHTWSRPDRRHIANGIYMPSQVREGAGRLAIVMDTSMSTDIYANEFFACLKELVEQVNPDGVDIAYVDAVFQRADHFDRGDDLKLRWVGGGGTAFAPGFRWAMNNLDDEPKGILYFTDLEAFDYGPDPMVPVMWVCPPTVAHPSKRRWVEAVPFGRIVLMTEEV